MKGVDHRAKFYWNKTMSSSQRLQENLFNQMPIKANQRKGENGEMKQSQGKKESDSGFFRVPVWHGATASHTLCSMSVWFRGNAMKVVLVAVVVYIDQEI